MRKIVLALVAVALVGVGAAGAILLKKENRHYVRPAITDAEQHNAKMNDCIKASLERHPGAVIEVEMEQDDGRMLFDIDIQGKDGNTWEIECDAVSGEIVEDGLDR
ncbi:MAG: PepSY domain-containing protein [Methylotenera sp.]|nr:PepSY domain-containing protein [Methylotenera sp.]